MAFDRTNLGLDSASHNSGNGPRFWQYTTTDTAATIDSAGYFNDAADLLTVGDQIHAIADSGGTPAYGFFYVSANDGTTVDVNDQATVLSTVAASLGGGGTDTD